MPLQRRLPKRGFVSPGKKYTAEVRLSELNTLEAKDIDIQALKQAGIVPIRTLSAKVMLSGKITRAIKIKGLRVSKGARAAIEAVGGSIETPKEKKVEKAEKAEKVEKV